MLYCIQFIKQVSGLTRRYVRKIYFFSEYTFLELHSLNMIGKGEFLAMWVCERTISIYIREINYKSLGGNKAMMGSHYVCLSLALAHIFIVRPSSLLTSSIRICIISGYKDNYFFYFAIEINTAKKNRQNICTVLITNNNDNG